MTVIKWLDIYVSVRTQDRQSRSPTINTHGYYLRSIGVVYCVAIDVYSFTMTVWTGLIVYVFVLSTRDVPYAHTQSDRH